MRRRDALTQIKGRMRCTIKAATAQIDLRSTRISIRMKTCANADAL
jgi:hypothetical protein